MATASDGGAAQRKAIYRTALILTALTAFEFLIAGTKGYFPSWFGISDAAADAIVLATFVILTIFKAFYIVAEFMHLKHEIKRLALTIVLPFVFIVWLIIGLLVDGNFWGSKESIIEEDRATIEAVE